MLTERSIEIEAPAGVVWAVYADVERWPQWTASVTGVRPLDGSGLGVGKRFEIHQPRFPKLVWTVTALDPGRAWTWEQRAPGGRSLATHEVVALSPKRTRARMVIEQRGPVGVLVGVLTRRLARRYLDLEAQGLKATSEARARSGGTPA